MTTPGICTYQFTSPSRSNCLIFLLNELRLSVVLSFLGSLDQMREPKYYIECPPYRTGSNFGSLKSLSHRLSNTACSLRGII